MQASSDSNRIKTPSLHRNVLALCCFAALLLVVGFIRFFHFGSSAGTEQSVPKEKEAQHPVAHQITPDELGELFGKASDITCMIVTWPEPLDGKPRTLSLKDTMLSTIEAEQFFRRLQMVEAFSPAKSVRLGPPYFGEISLTDSNVRYTLTVPRYHKYSVIYLTVESKETKHLYQVELHGGTEEALDYLRELAQNKRQEAL